MSGFETLAALVTITAAFAYVNHRWLRQPTAIGLMAMAVTLSLALVGLNAVGWMRLEPFSLVLERIHFDRTLLHGMLGALLFAGSLQIRVDDLRDEKLAVSILAGVGTLLSTLVIAVLAYTLLPPLGISLSFGVCALFGAVISPTDPIAVLGTIRHARVPRAMEIQIAGESLFNDGVGIVVFTTVLEVLARGNTAPLGVAVLFARETLGGLVFGLGAGYVTYRLLRSIDHYQTELLLTIALVLGGYSLAERIGVSAPLAAVAAGLVIGNQGRVHGMSDVTRDHLDKFWSLVDETLNAVLFVLVGFQVMRLALTRDTVLAGAVMIPTVLLARWLSVALPVRVLSRWTRFAPGTVRVLTWGGLRGGISVALALSVPGEARGDFIVTMTYLVAAFSILVQGPTLGRLARKYGEGTSNRTS